MLRPWKIPPPLLAAAGCQNLGHLPKVQSLLARTAFHLDFSLKFTKPLVQPVVKHPGEVMPPASHRKGSRGSERMDGPLGCSLLVLAAGGGSESSSLSPREHPLHLPHCLQGEGSSQPGKGQTTFGAHLEEHTSLINILLCVFSQECFLIIANMWQVVW